MSRFAALLMLAVVGAATVAAPAPRPKPWPAGQWLVGWDNPVDPLKDCRFDRKAEQLAITIPEGKPALARRRSIAEATAPHVARDVRGDFVAEVRVFGSAPPVLRQGDFSRAGLLVSEGAQVIKRYGTSPGYEWTRPCLIRVARRGEVLTAQYIRDGKQVYELTAAVKNLPRKLKVGVFAECDMRGGFKAEFDQFKLTPLGGKGR